MSGIWWTKMEHKEDFCEHFCEMSDKEIVADIRKSINSFLKQRADGADFGAKMVKKALDRITSKHDSAVANGSLGGQATAVKKKSPQDAPNGNAGVDMYDAGNGAASKSPTSCDQFTADGDIREDSQDRKSGTSANNYGDAATREGAEVVDSRESGAAVPTTVSRNMRRVPQNEAPAHGFSGGRTAQGTMSRSPEAAAQSGKDYDQEAAKTRDTRDDSRGRYAPPSCSPEDGNPAETAPSHGGSVASLEARQGQARESRRTGGSSVRGMAKVAQPSVRSRASFRNKEDFIQWAIDDGLDPVDAGECWEATEERGGKDADGNTVKNMKAFARQWCRTRANNRRTA
ncbi:MAG: hypothetical protein IKP90_05075 [Fibrobacter sp.]|nr:hypothetical protein [Fibrobacter sp.]